MMRKFLSVLFVVALLAVAGCSEEKENPGIFVVKFDSRGGSTVAGLTVEDGSKITKPQNPVMQNAIFVNWYKEPACTNPWNFQADIVTANITLYAKWTTQEYTVTYNTNGGNAIDPQPVADGAQAIRPLPPVKSGAAFDGWYKDQALNVLYDFDAPVTGNITLYAKWTVVTVESLQALIAEGSRLDSRDYTPQSFATLSDALNAANNLIYSSNTPTAQQIADAYTALGNAIEALVALPKRLTVALEIWPRELNNYLYVTPGEYFYLNAYGIDANGDPSTNDKVTFLYAGLEAWAEAGYNPGNSPVNVTGNGLGFPVKTTLAAGTTIKLTVQSAEFPAIAKTLTLMVSGKGELKNMFIAAVNALPAPDKVTYDHCDAIWSADDLYYLIPSDERQEASVQQAYNKLKACQIAYEDLPVRIYYSFTGDQCKFIVREGSDEETVTLAFVANGTFPAGTYSMTQWMPEEKTNYYTQNKFELKAGGSYAIYTRKASDNKGSNATQWMEDGSGTYTHTGDKASGGIFYLSWDDEEMLPGPDPVPGSKKTVAGKRPSGTMKKLMKTHSN